MKDNTFLYILLIVIGLFSVVSSVLNLDFFFNSRKAQVFLSIFGRTGARVFYTLFGAGIIVLAILLMTGVIKNR